MEMRILPDRPNIVHLAESRVLDGKKRERTTSSSLVLMDDFQRIPLGSANNVCFEIGI